MKHWIRISLVIAALAAPVTLAAQAERAAPRGPVARLLEHRGPLALSAEQVARLETIERELTARNAPLAEQLRAARPGEGGRPRDLTPEQRRELRERMRSNRPAMRQLRDNAREAMHQAREVLTQEQRQRARELVREGRERGGRQRPDGRGRRRDGGARGRR